VNDERFIEASRVAQAIVLAMIVAGVGFFAASAWLANHWIPDGGASLEEIARIGERFLVASLGFGIVAAACWSFYFGRIGFRAIANGEFPPPGTLVVRRTKVKFGSTARVSGWLSIALAIIVWLPLAIAVYALYFIERAT